MKIENKKTKDVKFFRRRDDFINFLLSQNKEIKINDLYKLDKKALVEKYLKDWFVVVE